MEGKEGSTNPHPARKGQRTVPANSGQLPESTRCAKTAATELEGQSPIPPEGGEAPPQLPQRVESLSLLMVSGLLASPTPP